MSVEDIQFVQGVLDSANGHMSEGDYLKCSDAMMRLHQRLNNEPVGNRAARATYNARHEHRRTEWREAEDRYNRRFRGGWLHQRVQQSVGGVLGELLQFVQGFGGPEPQVRIVGNAGVPAPAPAAPAAPRQPRRQRRISDIPTGTRVYFTILDNEGRGTLHNRHFVVNCRGMLEDSENRNASFSSLPNAARHIGLTRMANNWWDHAWGQTSTGEFSDRPYRLNAIVPLHR